MAGAEPIGKVDSLFGEVTARNENGEERSLQAGDPIFSGESILTSGSGAAVLAFDNGIVKGIAGDSEINLHPEFYQAKASAQENPADIAAEGAVAEVADDTSAEAAGEPAEDSPGPEAAQSSPAQLAPAVAGDDMAIGELTSASGKVFAESPDGSVRPLEPGDPVFLTDLIRTDFDSMALLNLSDGSRRGLGSKSELALESLESQLVINLEPTTDYTAVGIGEPDSDLVADEPWIAEGAVQQVAGLDEVREPGVSEAAPGAEAQNLSPTVPESQSAATSITPASLPSVAASSVPLTPAFTQFSQVGDLGPMPNQVGNQAADLTGEDGDHEAGFGPYFIDRNASGYRSGELPPVGVDTDALGARPFELDETESLFGEYGFESGYAGPIEVDLEISEIEDLQEPDISTSNQPPVARDDSDVVESDLGSTTTGNVIGGVVGGVSSDEGADEDPNQDPLSVTQVGATTSLDALTTALGDLTGVGGLLEAVDLVALLPVDSEVPPLQSTAVEDGAPAEVQGLYGKLVLDGAGGYTYTVGEGVLSDAQALLDLLPADTTVPEVFQYTVSDGRGGTDTATLTIDVGGTNAPPVARDDSDVVESDLGSTTTGNVIGGVVGGVSSDEGADEDPNQDPLSVTQVGATTSLDALTTALGDLTGVGGLLEAVDLVALLPVDSEVPPLQSTAVEDGAPAEVQGLYGKLVLDGAGGYTYTVGEGVLSDAQALLDLLPADTTVPEVFQYTVSDGRGGTDTATLTIDVGGTNQPPVARDDSDVVESDLGSTTTGNVIGGVVGGVSSDEGADEDPNQDPLSVTQVGATTSLDALTTALGDLTGVGGLLEAVDLVALLPVDSEVPPLQSTAVEDGAPAEVQGLYGKLVLDGAGGYTYTVGEGVLSDAQALLDLLPADTTVPEVFQYTVSDGRGGTDTATLTIDVGGTNQPPVARDDSDVVESDLGSTTTGNVIGGVVGGVSSDEGADEDPNQDPLSVTQVGATTSLDALTTALGDLTGVGGLLEAVDLVALLPVDSEVPPLQSTAVEDGAPAEVQGLYGKLVLDGAGGYTYTVGEGVLSDAQALLDLLPADTTVPEVFQYTVSDGRGGTDTATLTIDVGGTNQPPVARDDSDVVESDLGSTTTGNVIGGVVGGVSSDEGADEDPNQDPLSVTQVGATTSLDALTTALGDLTGVGGLLEAVDLVALLPVDSEVPPLQSTAVEDGAPAEVQGLYGKLVLDGAGGYTYTVGEGVLSDAQALLDLLPADTTVPEVFQYTVSDGRGGTDTATLTIDVGGTNAPPVARDDSDVVESDLGSTTTGNVIGGVVGGVSSDEGADEDPNQDPLSVTQVGATTSLDALTTALGDLTGVGGLLEAVDLVALLPVDSEVPPLQSTAVEDGAPAEVQGLYGKLVLDGAGGYTYTVGEGVLSDAQALLDLLPADTTVPEVFQYTVSDGRGGTDTATLTIDVGGTNQPPVARDDSDVVESGLGSTTTGNVIGGVVGGVSSDEGADEDPNQDPLSVTQVGATTSLDALTTALGDLTGVGGLLEAVDLVALLPVDSEVPPLQSTAVEDGAPAEVQGLYGKLVLDGAGGYTYTVGEGVLSDAQALLDLLPADTTVPEVFQYTVSDGRGGTDTATLTIDVGGTNAPPVARDDSDVVESDLGSTTTGNVIGGVVGGVSSDEGADEDPNQDPLSVTQVGATTSLDALTTALGDLTGVGGLLEAVDLVALLPVDSEVPPLQSTAVEDGAPAEVQGLYGKLVLDGAGGYTYTVGEGVLSDAQALLDLLPADTTVPEVFQYTVSDGRGGTDTATLTIDVGGANAPPVAYDDTDTVVDDGDAATADTTTGNVISGVPGGTDTDGNEADTDPNAADIPDLVVNQVTVSIDTGELGELLGTLDPTGALLSIPDTVLAGTPVAVVVNDETDAAGGAPVQGLYGNLNVFTDGTYTYTAGDGYLNPADAPVGLNDVLSLLPGGETYTDAFGYTIEDPGGLSSNVANLTIAVGPENVAPVAYDDTDTVVDDGDAATADTTTGNVISGVPGGTDTDGNEADTDPNAADIADLVVNQVTVSIDTGELGELLGTLDPTGALLSIPDTVLAGTPVAVVVNDETDAAGGAPVQGLYGNLNVFTDGTYTYTAGDGYLNPADAPVGLNDVLSLLPGGETYTDAFGYTIEDPGGLSSNVANLTIAVGPENVAPVAFDDTDTVVDDGNAETVDSTEGNVITGEGTATGDAGKDTDPNAADIPDLVVNQVTVSIDTGELGELLGTLDPTGALLSIPDTVLAGTPVAVVVNDETDAAGGAPVQGLYGNLNVFTDGTYTYTAGDGYLNPADAPVGLNDVLSLLPGGETYTDAFGYTIEDPGGLSSNVANLTIAVGPENVAPVAFDDTDTVVDDGNAETVDSTEGNVITGEGTATGDAGKDTDPNAADIPDLVVNQVTVSIDTGELGELLGTLDPTGALLSIPDTVLAGTPVAVVVNDETDAAGGAPVQGLYGNLNVFTDGTYTYTAGDGYLNPADAPVGLNDVLSLLPGGETYTDAFGYTIEDPGGLSSNVANLTIAVGPENVAPVAYDDTDTVVDDGDAATADTTTGNVISGVPGGTDTDGNEADTDPNAADIADLVVNQVTVSIDTGELGELLGTLDPTGALLSIPDTVLAGTPVAVVVNDETDAAGGAPVQGLYGNLNVFTDGTYTYTAGDGYLNPADAPVGLNDVLSLLPGGETYTDAFGYTIEDPGGLSSNVANLTIAVGPENVAPVAFDDTDTVVDDGNAETVDSTEGNVITGEGTATGDAGKDTDPNLADIADLVVNQVTVSIDTGELGELLGTLDPTGALLSIPDTVLAGTPVAVVVNDETDAAGGAPVQGLYGNLNVFTNGTYTYTAGDGYLNPADAPVGLNDVLSLLPGGETYTDAFGYTIEDPGGLSSNVANLTIAVGPENVAPVAFDDTDTVVDDGNAETVDSTEGNVITGEGTATGDAGKDTDPNLADVPELKVNQFQLTMDLTESDLDALVGQVDPLGLLPALPVVPGVPITVAVNAETDEAGGAQLKGLYGNLNVFADGRYTYTAGDGYLNPADAPVGVNDVLSLLPGGEAYTDAFSYMIEDPGGLTSNVADLTIAVGPENVAPVAFDDTDTVVDDGNAETVDSTEGNVITGEGTATGDAGKDTDPNLADVPELKVNQFQLTMDLTESDLDALVGQVDPLGLLPALPVVPGVPITVAVNAETDEAGGAQLKGLYGNLNVFTDGRYTYTAGDGYLNPADAPVGVNDVLSLLPGGEAYTDAFSYMIEDPGGLTSNVADLTIAVGPENVAPQANPDAFTVQEGSSVNEFDVLANDSDPDGQLDPASLNITSGPGNGTVSIVDGKVVYNPNDGYAGSDSFTYEVSDNAGEADGAVATIKVNRSPALEDDSFRIGENASDQILDVLLNDVDSDGTIDPTSLEIIDGPASGTATINEGKIVYTPEADFSGSDSIVYSVVDNDGGISSATATIQVSAPPTAVPPADIATDEDSSVSGTLGGSDPENDELTFAKVPGSESAGSVTVNPDGTFTFDPGSDFQTLGAGESAIATFEYSVSDGISSDVATVSVVVGGVNDAPDVGDVDLGTRLADKDPVGNGDGSITFTSEQLLAASEVVDSASLTIEAVGVVASIGEVTRVGTSDEWKFTPTNSDYSGVDIPFNFIVSDQEGGFSNGVAIVDIIQPSLLDPNALANQIENLVTVATELLAESLGSDPATASNTIRFAADPLNERHDIFTLQNTSAVDEFRIEGFDASNTDAALKDTINIYDLLISEGWTPDLGSEVLDQYITFIDDGDNNEVDIFIGHTEANDFVESETVVLEGVSLSELSSDTNSDQAIINGMISNGLLDISEPGQGEPLI